MLTMKHLALAALCGLGLATTALAREGAATPSNAFRPGEEVVASVDGSPLMRGDSTVAVAAAGQRLRVLKVEGPWVGTAVTVNGARIGGWIWSRQLATPRQYQTLRQSARRSYSYQPAPVYGGAYQGYYLGAPAYSQPFLMGVTPYGGSYWRADRKVIGY